MTAYMLWYREPSAWNMEYAWIDKFAGLYGLYPIVIDTSRAWAERPIGSPPKIYHSLENALACDTLAGCEWVWLDVTSDTYIDEYDHPTGTDVVYCLGGDMQGFEGRAHEDLPPGTKLKARPPTQDYVDAEFHAAVVAAMLAYDRFLKINGRRL